MVFYMGYDWGRADVCDTISPALESSVVRVAMDRDFYSNLVQEIEDVCRW